MNIAPLRAAVPPVDPTAELRATARTMLVDARDAVTQAAVATSTAGHYDPTMPFWTHRATWNIGYATGLLQAVAATQQLAHVTFPLAVYTSALDEARTAVADVGAARQSGTPVDLTALAKANFRLTHLLGQFDFDIHKHDPLPVPAP